MHLLGVDEVPAEGVVLEAKVDVTIGNYLRKQKALVAAVEDLALAGRAGEARSIFSTWAAWPLKLMYSWPSR